MELYKDQELSNTEATVYIQISHHVCSLLDQLAPDPNYISSVLHI